MQVDRLRLLGSYGANKVMAGELSRIVRRGFTQERSRELREVPPKKFGPGAIAYPFAPDLAALALCYHRTCARVLWDLYEVTADRLEPLYDELLREVADDTRDWLVGIESISVQAFGTGPVQAGERQVVGTVKNAILDGAAKRGVRLRVEPNTPGLLICARPISDEGGNAHRLAISIDLAGKPMHQRGYRLSHGVAPLREDLAAQLLFLARYDAKREAVIDPLAGSGTLLIEAALLGSAAPVSRAPAPTLSPLACLRPHLAELGAPLFGDTQACAIGAELDEATCDAFWENAQGAGVSEQLELFGGDFRELKPDEKIPSGLERLVLSNPPYGSRIAMSESELRDLYRDLGHFCRRIKANRAAFLVGEPDEGTAERESSVALFLRSFGGRPRIRKPISNGPLRAQFLLYELNPS